MHAICHNSVLIYSLSVDKLFIGWLVEFHTILDSLQNGHSQYHIYLYIGAEGGVVEGGFQVYKIFYETKTQPNSLT